MSARQTFAAWSAQWPYLVRPFHGGPAAGELHGPAIVYSTPDTFADRELRAEAFQLSDAVVTSVVAGSLWFTIRAAQA